MRPPVSIGLPVYNGADYLPAALDSLLTQDFSDFELIISDNASTDQTREICNQYASRDPRVRYSCNQQNIGPIPNFLRTLELATGDYFMWAAHDDQWSPDYIRRLLSGFDAGGHVLLVAGRTLYVTETGSPHIVGDSIGGPSAAAPPKDIVPARDLVGLLLTRHATSWFYGIYRRDALAKLTGLLETVPVWGGDVLFLIHCCLHHQIVGDNDAVIYKQLRHLEQLKSPRDWVPKTPRAWVKWQATFSARILREVLTAEQPWQERWAALEHVRPYLQRMIFKKGPKGTAKLWLRAAYQLSQGRDHA